VRRVTSPASDAERVTVVRIIDRLNIGGPALHAVLTAEGLDRRRFRTVLVFGSVEPGEGDMGYLLDDLDIEYHVIPALGRELRPWRDLATTLELIKILRRERPRVVHTHKAKAGALGRLAALIAGVPVRIHTFHGHVFSGYFGAAKTKLFIAIERVLARRTTKLVALSQQLVEELSAQYRIAPADRFRVVPLGLDLEPLTRCQEHRGILRRELGVSDAVRLVGIVGRMVPVKDHATFVAAATLLAAKRPEVHFVFVGAGELEAEVRAQLAANGLSERAHLLGWRRDLPKIYADLDVVALSSVNEGTPVALIEAMAAGVPVVSTAVGGVADVLGHGARGELVAAGDAEALSEAIERALLPAAKERASGFRAEVAAEYGQARLCRDLGTLYDELLDNQRTRR
jgi:glycosyltransferase involved in cell wall biosynthesis